MENGIQRLNLLSPLYYSPIEKAEAFDYTEGGPEMLFCFALEEKQRLSFEADGKELLKELIFGGKAASGPVEGMFWELPGGNYLFAQKREILDRQGIIALAIEIQQEGLWQRLQPGDRLYLRYLYEDNCGVTQLFRPYT